MTPEPTPTPAQSQVGTEATVWSAALWQPGVQEWRLVGTEGDRDHALSEAADWKRDLYDGERIAIAFQTRTPWHIRTAIPAAGGVS